MSKAQRKKRNAKNNAEARSVKAADNRPMVTQEEIAQRAYELFLARGGEPGHDVEDWLEAERQLQGEN